MNISYPSLYFKVFCSIIFISLFTYFQPIKAQDCKDIIKKADQAYQEGHLNEVKTILSDECIKALSKKEEKQQAYYILTLVHLYLNEKDEAKVSMLNLLAIDPEYVFEPSTPLEFQKFYDTFKVRAKIVLGLKVGLNFSEVNSLKAFSLDNTQNNDNGSYKSLFGYQFQGLVIVPLSRRFEIMTEIGFKNYGYQFSKQNFGYSNLKFV